MKLKTAPRDLKNKLRESRKHYGENLEKNVIKVNSRNLWNAVKAKTNITPTRKSISAADGRQKADELSEFFSTFKSPIISSDFNDCNVGHHLSICPQGKPKALMACQQTV